MVVPQSVQVLLPLLAITQVLGAGSYPNCVSGPLATNLVCDPTASIVDRAKAVVDEFTVDEIAPNMGNTAAGVPRLGLPRYEWWNEALHGVAEGHGVKFQPAGQNFSSATSFPTPLNLGAAFHDALAREVATIISTESRAFNNFGFAGLDFWTPNINPFKGPRWGRGLEVPSEDPLHISRYVMQLIPGLQGEDGDKYLKVAADCKHWAAYDMEGWGGVSRHEFNAIVSPQDMSEYYAPPFQSCVRDAKVASVMCAYNAVNGAPACANSYLIQDILRDHWGFNRPDNWIVSDCGAMGDIWTRHKYTATGPAAAAAAMGVGVNLDCGSVYRTNLTAALDEGLVNEGQLRQALYGQYASLVKLGYFDPAEGQPYRKLSWADVNTPAAQSLARTAATEGLVLLKNDGTLPIKSSIRNVALIGPYSNATTQMQGNYFGRAPFLITPLQGLRDAEYNVTFVLGTNISTTSTDGFAAALTAARAADIVVYAGGIDLSIEAESRDRTTIVWPGNQLDLIKQLADVGKPLVVVQFGGGQVDGSWLKSSTKASALLWAGYPGQSGGHAIADVLKGVVSPAGRLPITQYPAEYVNQVKMYDMTLRPNATSGSPGRTYKWYTGTPVYEFGFGLHYTTFEVKWSGDSAAKQTYNIQKLVVAAREAAHLDLGLLDTFEVSVENTGSVTSDYVALLFVNTDVGPSPAPLKELLSYDRVLALEPGQSKTASLVVDLGTLSRVDVNGDRHLYPGTYNLWIDVDKKIARQIELTGETEQIGTWPRAAAV